MCADELKAVTSGHDSALRQTCDLHSYDHVTLQYVLSPFLGCIECEMQTIVTNARGVCLSVTRLKSASLCNNGSTDPDTVRGEQSWSQGTLCYTRFLTSTIRGRARDNLAHCGILHISATAERK